MRKLLATATLLAASTWAHADVSVVKVVNFSCPYCRSSEAMDEPIRQAAQRAGGKLVYATLPADETSQGDRELVYYAARSVFPAQEPAVRASLYRGAQDLGYPLQTKQQTLEWLATDLEGLKLNWSTVAAAADGTDAQQAFERAVRLTVKSGAQLLPSYIVVKDGQLLRTLDVESSGGTYSALREAVLTAIDKAQATPSLTIK